MQLKANARKGKDGLCACHMEQAGMTELPAQPLLVGLPWGRCRQEPRGWGQAWAHQIPSGFCTRLTKENCTHPLDPLLPLEPAEQWELSDRQLGMNNCTVVFLDVPEALWFHPCL